MNQRQRDHLQQIISLLSDGHEDVTATANDLNNSILKLDVRIKAKQALNMDVHAVGRRIKRLDAYLKAQGKRIQRTRDELKEIDKTVTITW